MAALIILLFFLSGAASDLHVVTVNPGENVILECVAGDAFFTVVEWTRDDLEPKYILFAIDGYPEPNKQNPSFKDRVELEDRKMGNGDASLVLKNVSSEDRGTYECRVRTAGSSRRKRAFLSSEPINIIQLEVRDSGNGDPKTDDFTRGYVGLAAAGVVVVVMCSVIVGLFLVRKYKRHPDNRSERSAADEAAVHQLM